jgi:hypothetical protein
MDAIVQRRSKSILPAREAGPTFLGRGIMGTDLCRCNRGPRTFHAWIMLPAHPSEVGT